MTIYYVQFIRSTAFLAFLTTLNICMMTMTMMVMVYYNLSIFSKL